MVNPESGLLVSVFGIPSVAFFFFLRATKELIPSTLTDKRRERDCSHCIEEGLGR